MARPHRHRIATPNPGRAPPLVRQCAHCVAAGALVALATACLAEGHAAASDGGGPSRRGAFGTAGGPATVPESASAATPKRAPAVRLAYSGDDPCVAFLKGLFGMEQRSERRRPSQLRRHAPPRTAPPAPPPPAAPDASTPETAGTTPVIETYRTMCVRLCDGYYWPISFSTPDDNFERDRRTCANSCNASVALYYYPNPGGEAEDMVSLTGAPYKTLGTAFLYRSTYDAKCKCRPHPWEAKAVERHQSYAKKAQTRAAPSGRKSGRRGRTAGEVQPKADPTPRRRSRPPVRTPRRRSR